MINNKNIVRHHVVDITHVHSFWYDGINERKNKHPIETNDNDEHSFKCKDAVCVKENSLFLLSSSFVRIYFSSRGWFSLFFFLSFFFLLHHHAFSHLHKLKITRVNRYGYPYFHRNCTEYGRSRSRIACKRTVLTCNAGHNNTALYTRPYFTVYGCIRSAYAS